MTDENERGFTADEEKTLREMIKERDRAKWFWTSVRVWAMGAAAVVGAFTLMYDAIVRFIKSAGGV